MQTSALSGGFADAPVEAAHAFRAALRALARPGQIQTVTGAVPPRPLSVAAGVLLLTLADPETPLFLAGAHDCPATREWVTFHCGAPIVAASDASLAIGRWDALGSLSPYRIGTSEYPDRSATLIVEIDDLQAAGAHLTGPGIQQSASLSLPAIAPFQRNAEQFPLGLDFLFTAGDRLAGLPRTTRVEAA